MELGMENRLQKLGEEMIKVGYKEHWIKHTKEWFDELQKSDVYDIDIFTRKLKARVDNKEAYSDILREGRFAFILARSGFSKITFMKEIKSCRLPDIKAEYSRQTIYFEIKRRRPNIKDEWAEESEAFAISPDSTENVISIIQNKLRQLIEGEINILVLWSDTISLDKIEVMEAFKYIQQEIESNPESYKRLSGLLITNGGFSIPSMKQCRLFRNDTASKPLSPRIAKKLDCLNEKSPKQLEKASERWNTILKITKGLK